jgi:predicted DNA-binding transcriptional regulator AlpA
MTKPAVVLVPDACVLTGLSRSTLRRLEIAGQFPQRRRLSPGRVGFVLAEIEAWIEERAVGISAPLRPWKAAR